MPPKPSPTHFLCIPLVTATSRSQLTASLAAFSADVTSQDSFAVPAGAVRPVGTLHLTLGVMSFPKNEGLDKAIAILKTLHPQKMLSGHCPPATALESLSDNTEEVGLHPPRLSVTLKGLRSMQPAAKCTTLYSPPVDSDGTLQVFCEKIKQAFMDAEIMVDDRRPLLLHATIVNTIYVKDRRQGRRREKLTIDARGILDRYDDRVWMEQIPVEKIAICRMGAKDLEGGADQAYEVEAEIEMKDPE